MGLQLINGPPALQVHIAKALCHEFAATLPPDIVQRFVRKKIAPGISGKIVLCLLLHVSSRYRLPVIGIHTRALAYRPPIPVCLSVDSACFPVGCFNVVQVSLRSPEHDADRKSVVKGKSVSVRVDLGGRSIFKKKNYESERTIQ